MGKTTSLNLARTEKNDEFYTRYEDVEKEAENYSGQLEGQHIYCPCDDYRFSKFVQFFKDNFHRFKLKKLTATNYDIGAGAYVYEYDGENEKIAQLPGSGDFRSDEVIEYLKQCDIVVTNPPFSLFREFIAQVLEYDKKFLIIGNVNAIPYKEIFPLIQNNKIWLGVSAFNTGMYFEVPENYVYADSYKSDRIRDGKKVMRVSSICWFTNLDNKKRHAALELTKTFSSEYPHYYNYDAIEISKVVDIPLDYDGVMGVPITFLNKYCPDQFEIVGCCEPCIELETYKKAPCFKGEIKSRQILKNGVLCQKTYHRILVQFKK